RFFDDEPAGRGTPAKLSSDQGERSRFVHGRRPAEGEQLQQYDLRRRQGRDRLSPSPVRAAPQRPLRLFEDRRRQRSRDRLGVAPLAPQTSQSDESAQRLGRQQQ